MVGYLLDVACTFAGRPELVLLDEPCSSAVLSVQMKKRILNLIKEEKKIGYAGILLVSNSNLEVTVLSNEIAIITSGPRKDEINLIEKGSIQ